MMSLKMIKGGDVMNLKEFVKKYKQFENVFDFLEPFLEEKPERIKVYSFEEATKQGFKIRETVNAFVLKPDRVYFRYIPPDLVTFTHELIHLCRKDDDIDEEVYSYNLTEAVIYATEKCIKANIFSLFKLTREDIEKVLRDLGFRSIEEFYLWLGVIPTTHELVKNGATLTIKAKDGLTDDIIVQTFITEIVAGLRFDSVCESVFLKILKEVIR